MPVDLESIKKRLAAAEPGPWQNVDEQCVRHAEPNIYAGDREIADVFERNNADFVAHAPADIAALIEEVGRLRIALEERSITWALKQSPAIRLSYGWRWLVWDGQWEVWERTGGGVSLIKRTEEETEAVSILLEEPTDAH